MTATNTTASTIKLVFDARFPAAPSVPFAMSVIILSRRQLSNVSRSPNSPVAIRTPMATRSHPHTFVTVS